MKHIYQKQADAETEARNQGMISTYQTLSLRLWHMQLLPFGLQIFLSILSCDSGLQEGQGLE